MYKELNSEFFILDYSPSHSQLLIRSKKNKNRGYNIDVFFKGVSMIYLSARFTGININVLDINENILSSIEKMIFESNPEGRLYVLTTSTKEVYYINATSLGVYHNQLDILESSIGRYDFEDLGEFVLWDVKK